MNKPSIQSAQEYLLRSPVFHVDMLEALKRGGTLLSAGNHGVMLSSSGVLMMTADSRAEADEMLNSLSPFPPLLEVHGSFCRDAVEAKGIRNMTAACFQAVWTRKEPLPPVPSPAEIRPLGKSSLLFVMKHYSRSDDADYLGRRLESGDFFGAFLGGKLAGFIGTHDEGSMGMLEILPEYRRLGIARQLETFEANHLLGLGRTPFAQIISDNEASLSLHQRLGMEISKEILYWFESCK